jgi:hypothetical protein
VKRSLLKKFTFVEITDERKYLKLIMNSITVISNRLDGLVNLLSKDVIFLEDVREEFRPDLQKFIIGETLSMRNGKLVIGNNLFKKWISKISKQGFDYEIDFKK